MASPLQEWCDTHGAGPGDLADLTGYSDSYMSLILNGKREPPAHVKVTIAHALGKRVGVLFPPPAAREPVGA
jgi:transcriptional regulator with XRE-family HTH domain